MSRTFIATIMAVTIAITGLSAAPARAGENEDLARLLAGAATLFIIGKAIADSKERDRKDKRRATASRHDNHNYNYNHNPRHRPGAAGHDRHPDRDRHDRYDRARKVLPSECFSVQGRGDDRAGVFGARCLQRNYRHADDLPRYCVTRAGGRGKSHRAYDARCLRGDGYTMSRR